ncbi:MAG: AAA family ATPase [bacterium]
MKKIYITGISGTGKSAIAEELNKKGIYTIDVDSDKHNLCSWKNKETKENVYFEYGMGLDWMEDHGWYCDIEKLKGMLNVPEDIIVVVGLTTNQNEYLNLFDKVFLLQCSEETFLNRLKTRTSNDFGKHPLEENYILNMYKDLEKDLIEKGAIAINAEGPIETVVGSIISKI